jgi:hypothetical protein
MGTVSTDVQSWNSASLDSAGIDSASLRPAETTAVTADVDGFISGSRPDLAGLPDARFGQRLLPGVRVRRSARAGRPGLRIILYAFIGHIKFSLGRTGSALAGLGQRR